MGGARRGRVGPAGAALLLLAAPVPPLHAAEGTAAPEVRCAAGRLTLAADNAPAGRVFALLASACGVELRRAELLSDRFVTAAYRDAPLEEALRDLVRLTGIAGSLRVSSLTGALTVFLLPVGTEGPPAASPEPAGDGAPAARVDGAAGAGAAGPAGGPRAAPPPGVRATSSSEGAGDGTLPAWQQAAAALARLSPEEAWVLRNLSPEDFAEERLAASVAQARRRFLFGETEADRQDGLRALRQLDPAEAAELDGAEPELLDDEREAQTAEEARRAYLLATDPGERERAMAWLRQIDPFEARELEGLPPESLAEEREEAAKERAKRDYYLSLAPEEQARIFRDLQKRLPE